MSIHPKASVRCAAPNSCKYLGQAPSTHVDFAIWKRPIDASPWCRQLFLPDSLQAARQSGALVDGRDISGLPSKPGRPNQFAFLQVAFLLTPTLNAASLFRNCRCKHLQNLGFSRPPVRALRPNRNSRPDGASRAMDSRLESTRRSTRSESPVGQRHNESDPSALKTAPNPICITGQCRRSSRPHHPTRRKCSSEERPDNELATRGRCQAARATGFSSRASATSTPTLVPNQLIQSETCKQDPARTHREDGKKLRPWSR